MSMEQMPSDEVSMKDKIEILDLATKGVNDFRPAGFSDEKIEEILAEAGVTNEDMAFLNDLLPQISKGNENGREETEEEKVRSDDLFKKLNKAYWAYGKKEGVLK